MTPSTTMSSPDLTASLEIIEIKPGTRFSLATLRSLLPDVETVLFFGKVYELDYAQLSYLMSKVLQSDLARELFSGEHSTDLQDYLIGYAEHESGCESLDPDYPSFCTCNQVWVAGIVPQVQRGDVTLNPSVPHGEILPQMWEQLEVEVAQSIKDVAAKLESVVGLMPGKHGHMVFGSMMKLNAKRPTIGDYRASVKHVRQQRNLLILDVSGSMSSITVRTIVNDVVGLAYMANADMAVVSDTCTYWEAGTYSVDDVLRASEFSGTHYETLAPLFERQDWGVVITVADYDSSMDAKEYLANTCTGRIDTVLDISLVNRPTYLAECVGQFAGEVRPLLIANSTRVLRA